VGKLSPRFWGIALASGLCASLGLAACSSLDSASDVQRLDGGASSDASAPDSSLRPGDAGVASVIEANAIVLVHAAAFPAFRVCFDGVLGDQPQPSEEVMPEANVVGVDVGTAVRLPARAERLGRAFVFPEKNLRQYYPIVGVDGLTCQELLTTLGIKESAVEVGQVTEDLSRGVHALVLGGCLPSTDDPIASTDRCGADWNAAKGNLKLTTLSLMAYARVGDTRLSVQLLQLSPALQRRADGRALGLAFGPIDGGAPAPFIESAVPFGEAVPDPPATLDYAAADIESYATSGVFVTLGGALDDAGAPLAPDAGAAREVLVAQSLAEIQKRSSSRSLPSDWFSAASSYVMLSVGDTDPRLGDGGVDVDPRRALHLLAIPLATPDAGSPDASQ